MPSPRRSSEENEIRRSIAWRGEVMRAALPLTVTWPWSGRSAPYSSRTSSVRPEPSSPARPTTSPGYTSRSAGSSTPRLPTPSARSTGSPERSMVRCAERDERLEVVELAADHLGHQGVPGQLGDEVLADQGAVAQHGDPVGDLVDLVQEVGDEQDRDARVAQLADHAEELLDLVAVEAGRRLVQDEHLGLEHHGPADRDELLDGDRVGRQQRARVDVHAQAPQVAPGLGVGRPPVDRRAATQLVAEHDVLADRQVGAEVDLLVHGRDAGRLGVGRRGEGPPLARRP